MLEQFREYEWRTRYRARRELRDRPAAEVLPAVKAWAAKLDPADTDYDRLRCEALWVQQGHHAVDPELLKQVLAVEDARRPGRGGPHRRPTSATAFPDAFDLLKTAATDAHPRVRTEAVRGLSFYPTPEAVDGRPRRGEAAAGLLDAVHRSRRPSGRTSRLAAGVPDRQARQGQPGRPRRSSTELLAASKAGGGGGPVPAAAARHGAEARGGRRTRR